MTEPAHAQAEGRRIHITRVLDAPRDAVFEAWTDPGQVAAWWGPGGFDVPRDTITIDLRVGGRYDLCMVQAATGAGFWVRSEIVELVAGDLLVLGSDAAPEIGLTFPTLTRVEFRDDGAGTRVTVTGGLYSDEMAPNAEAGWSSSLDRLADRLAQRVS